MHSKLKPGSLQLLRSLLQNAPKSQRLNIIHQLLEQSIKFENRNQPEDAQAFMEYAEFIDEMVG